MSKMWQAEPYACNRHLVCSAMQEAVMFPAVSSSSIPCACMFLAGLLMQPCYVLTQAAMLQLYKLIIYAVRRKRTKACVWRRRRISLSSPVAAVQPSSGMHIAPVHLTAQLCSAALTDIMTYLARVTMFAKFEPGWTPARLARLCPASLTQPTT